jgi:hypothetical protein
VAPLPVYPDQLARLRAAKPGPSPEGGTDLGFRPRGVDEGLAAVRERPGVRAGDVLATEREPLGAR